eukprot:COSAG01_NODE_671_length_14345_cov_229.934728_8_plen_122_part_00
MTRSLAHLVFAATSVVQTITRFLPGVAASIVLVVSRIIAHSSSTTIAVGRWQGAAQSEAGSQPLATAMAATGWLAAVAQGPVRLQGWCNYDSRPDFRGPPTPLKSSLELQNSACRVTPTTP